MSPSVPICQSSKPLIRTRCPVPPGLGVGADQRPVVLGAFTLHQHLSMTTRISGNAVMSRLEPFTSRRAGN